MTARRGIIPAVLGAIVVVATLFAFLAARASASGPSTADRQELASTVAATVSSRVDGIAHLLAAASEAIKGDPSMPAATVTDALARVVTANRQMALVRTTSPTSASIALAVPESAAPLVGFDVAQRTEFRLALELSRDDGTAEIAAAPGPDGALAIIEALPLYGSTDVPSDVGSRRTALRGYLLFVLPGADPFGLAPIAGEGDFAVRVVQGDTVLSRSARATNATPPAATSFVSVAGTGESWVVQVWSAAPGSAAPTFVLLGGLLVAVAVALIALGRERSIAAAALEAERRAQELALVARTGPLLQQSLALSDLLPVFVVEISDEFGLDKVSISLVAESGRLVRVFALGADDASLDGDAVGLSAPTGTVAPGTAITVPLPRGGRVVGVLSARAVRGLSTYQLDALVTVCNLLAAALGNARLFQDEQEMVAKLRDVDRMKTTFVSSVSHELRTTVTAIDGFAGLLDGELPPEQRADFIERIRRNAKSLAVLVEDLLDFARFERSGIEVTPEPVDLSAALPQIVDQTSSLLGERAVTVDVEPDVVAMADPSAIERILVNLLSNASKYAPPESPIDVTLRRDGHNGEAVLTVADHGAGIPVEDRDRVFELFYRGPAATKQAARGVGIGLALARQLAVQLDGTISVSDTPGGGATFRVTIPLAPGPAPQLSASGKRGKA